MCATSAWAEGVLAGSVIENTATANFTRNGITQTVDSNIVSITVDEILDGALASQDGGPITSTGDVVLRFLLRNTGNGPETFDLVADPAVAGNDFDLIVDKIAIDTNANGVYDDGIDTVIPGGAATPSLDADTSLAILVVALVPASATDGQSTQLQLTVQAATGTGPTGAVFAGAGAAGVDAVVGLSGGQAIATGAVVASLTSVTLVKSASVTDPYGGSQPVPGAVVTYSLVASVQGSGSVTGLALTDPIPASTTYLPGSIELDGTPLTDAADADAGERNAAGISVLVGDAAAGSSYTVSFQVTIDK